MLWNHSNSTNNSNSIQYRVFRKYRLRTWDFLCSHRKDIQFQNLKYHKAFPKKVSQKIYPKIFLIKNISGYFLNCLDFTNTATSHSNHFNSKTIKTRHMFRVLKSEIQAFELHLKSSQNFCVGLDVLYHSVEFQSNPLIQNPSQRLMMYHLN